MWWCMKMFEFLQYSKETWSIHTRFCHWLSRGKIKTLLSDEIEEGQYVTQDALKRFLDSLKRPCHRRQMGMGLIFARSVCVRHSWVIVFRSLRANQLCHGLSLLCSLFGPGLCWRHDHSWTVLSVGRAASTGPPDTEGLLSDHDSLCFKLPGDVSFFLFPFLRFAFPSSVFFC